MKAMNISGNKRPPAQGSGRKELQEHRGIGNEEPMCRKCRNVSDQGLSFLFAFSLQLFLLFRLHGGRLYSWVPRTAAGVKGWSGLWQAMAAT